MNYITRYPPTPITFYVVKFKLKDVLSPTTPAVLFRETLVNTPSISAGYVNIPLVTVSIKKSLSLVIDVI
jgi:hypothetical protein